MSRRAAWAALLALLACGVKAPPRPPEAERPAAADGGAPPAGTCSETDGGCGR